MDDIMAARLLDLQEAIYTAKVQAKQGLRSANLNKLYRLYSQARVSRAKLEDAMSSDGAHTACTLSACLQVVPASHTTPTHTRAHLQLSLMCKRTSIPSHHAHIAQVSTAVHAC